MNEPNEKLKLDPINKPIAGQEARELSAEVQVDTHAARVRDYGEADAATYEGRVASAGADTTRHLEPNTPMGGDWMANLSIDDQTRKELAADLDRISLTTCTNAPTAAAPEPDSFDDHVGLYSVSYTDQLNDAASRGGNEPDQGRTR